MSRNNDSDLIMIAAGIVIALLAVLVWKFSTFFGLDMTTGLSVLWRLAVLIGATVAVRKVLYAEFADIWPLVAAGFWIAWWPALDYWGLQSGSMPVWAGYEGLDAPTVWWSTGYTKWGVLAAILGLGYSFRKWAQDR